MSTRSIGSDWEDAALVHLTHAGLTLLARNFTCRYGELDLIMREREQIVFVEVRYRGAHALGDGTHSVGAGKRAKLARAAAVYLQSQPTLANLPCRFDVIGCSGTLQHPTFAWTRNAFEVY